MFRALLKWHENTVIRHPVAILIVGALLTIFFVFFGILGADSTSHLLYRSLHPFGLVSQPPRLPGHEHFPGLHFSSSSDEFFIRGDPDKNYYEKAKSLFGNDQVVIVALVAPEGETIYTAERMAKLDKLTRDLASIKIRDLSGNTVEAVSGAWSLSNIKTIRLPRDPVTGEFQKQIEFEQLIKKIPQTPEEWEQLKREVNLNPFYKKNLVSEDGRAAGIVVNVKDFETQTKCYDLVMDEIKALMKAAEGPEQVVVVGIPETRVEMVKRMMKDLKIFLPLTFLLIVLTLIFNFRRVRGVALNLVGVITTTLWSLGFMGMADLPINMVTLILPPLLMSLGSAYSIYTMSGFLEEVRPERSVPEILSISLGKGTLPIMVTALINIFGFASLMLNNIPAIQELGFASIVSIFFAMMIAIFILPAILRLLKKPEVKLDPEAGVARFALLDQLIARLPRVVIHNRWLIFATAITLVLISIVGIFRIRVDTDFLHFFSKDDPVIKAVDLQTKYLAGAAPFNIVLEAEQENVFKDPAVLKKMEQLQKWALENVPGIDTTLSIVDFIKLVNQAFHENNPAFYKIPDSPAEVGQLLLFLTSGSPEAFSSYVTTDYSAANIVIRSRLVGSTETNAAIRKIEAKAKEIFSPPRFEPKTVASPVAQVPVPGAELSAPSAENEEELNWGETAPQKNPAPKNSAPPPPPPAEREEEINWGDPPVNQPSAEPAVGSTAPAVEKEEEMDWGEPSPPPASSQPAKPVATNAETSVSPATPHIQVHVTGTIYLMNKSADAVSGGQISGFSTALATTCLTMAVLFLSLRIGLLAILPNAIPIFILFGIMGYSGVTLNFSTALIAAIALGLGIDDTIHYIHHYNSEVKVLRDQDQAMVKTMNEMGKPMIYTSIALILGFAILGLSDFVPIQQFGFLTATSLGLAITSNLFVLPSLVSLVRFVTLWEILDLEIGDNPSRYIKIFHGLTNHQAKVAVLMGHIAEFKDGEFIIREGEMGNEMFIILKGYVNIWKGEPGHEVKVATIQPGDAFGEMALLRHTTRSASATAEGRVKLFVLDEQVLHRLQKRYPRISSQIFYNITQILSDRLQAATSQVVETAVDVKEKKLEPQTGKS